MVEIKSIDNKEEKTECIGCALQKGTIERYGGIVIETENFDVQQDYETPIPGFMIISAKKHIKGIEDLSEDERKEFIELTYKVRKAIGEILKVKYVYIIQKEDCIKTRSHFHVWLFPRYDWMEKFGDKIASVTKIIEYARKEMKTEDSLKNVKDSVFKLKKYLNNPISD